MTKEQKALLQKARDRVRAAEVLTAENLFDFAVSRAYYAMFYLAAAFLLGDGLAFSKHSAVISAFGQHFVKTGRVATEFHRYLIEAQDARQIADYDINNNLDANQSKTHIERAKLFIKEAETKL